VGMSREPGREPNGMPPATRATVIPPPSRRDLAAAVVALAVALGAVVTAMIVDLKGREAASRTAATRALTDLAHSEGARAGLAARLDALERDLGRLHDEASRQAEEARDRSQEDQRLRDELEATQGQVAALGESLRRREREIARLKVASDGTDMLRDLAAAPGLEILELQPVAPFRDIRGHALWRPGAGSVLLYAFALPPLPADGRYRLRLTLDDGRELRGPSFDVGTGGEARVPVRLDGGVPPRTIEVLLEPAGRPVLTWHRATG
ncbi:MAG TPA: hypothetical protein VKA21_05545, partial [Candidatus Binatia bacterium]|nr:hypothetical protein [Candidatus Binatia bacterium]